MSLHVHHKPFLYHYAPRKLRPDDGDGDGSQTKRPRESVVYEIGLKTSPGLVIDFQVTNNTTVAEFYEMVQNKEGTPPALVARLLFEGKRLPAWTRDKDEEPQVMIETSNLPLVRFWNLNTGKKNTVHLIKKFGGPRPTAITEKHELCPPLGIVRDYLRRLLLTKGVSFSCKVQTAHEVVKQLRHAYENYEFMTDSMKKCRITLDSIEETTLLNEEVVLTFPYPAPSEYGGRGRCIGFYDFAHLVTALKNNREWPATRIRLSDDDFRFIRVLALVLYGDDMGVSVNEYE